MKMKNTIKAIILATLCMSLSQFAVAAPPSNDNWNQALLMSGFNGQVTGTTVDATVQPCEPPHQWVDLAGTAPARASVWFKWVAPSSGSYTFRVTAPKLTTLSAYVMVDGTCNGNQQSVPYRVVENDLFAEMTPGTDRHSQVTFPVYAGTIVYFSADSLNDDRSQFVLKYAKTKYSYSTRLDARNLDSDLVVARPTVTNREWWFARGLLAYSYQNYSAGQFGRMTDKRAVGDYNGDGIADTVAARPENGHLTWWIATYKGYVIKVVTFGLATDKPIAGDYDGDGIADIAVTRTEATGGKTWHILRSKDGQYYSFPFGLSTDKETIGDFDGDGTTDVAVMRRNTSDQSYTWYIMRSSDGAMMSRVLGYVGDIPQAADMDDDGKTDLVVFRYEAALGIGTAGVWKWVSTGGPSLEQTPVQSIAFGAQHDIPQVGDYDGDGRDDIAVFRNGTWWMKRSSYGVGALPFGAAGDLPATDMGLAGSFFNIQ